MSYKLKLDVFEGPLDLLLYLIKKDDIDICDIPISKITDQYMEYIELMKMLDLDVVGDFLVMAATLMQIKSRMLLPPDPLQEEDKQEDPRDELMRRLQEYQMFKEVAERLKEKELVRQNLFPRQLDEALAKEMKDDAKEVYFEANLFDLISAFTKALNKFKEDRVYSIDKEEFTVEGKIHDVLHILLERERIVLADLFGRARHKMEMIVTFMAVLELIRLKEIVVMQKRLFDDIEVIRNRDNVIPEDKAAAPSTDESPSAPQGETRPDAPQETQDGRTPETGPQSGD